MEKYVIITDISKTLVMMQREDEENFNPYDEALQFVSQVCFGGIEMNMKMSEDGKLFPDHIAAVIWEAVQRAKYRCFIRDFHQAAQEIIDQYMREFLIRRFSERPVLVASGLDKFMNWIRGIHGVVTGDLRAVAKVLLTHNTYGDLTLRFPNRYMTCGDDLGLSNRVEQIKATFEKLNVPGERVWFIFLDDAANGIAAIRQFAAEEGLNGSALIIGVTTGNSNRYELIKAGANLVLPNIGEVPEAVRSILG